MPASEYNFMEVMGMGKGWIDGMLQAFRLSTPQSMSEHVQCVYTIELTEYEQNCFDAALHAIERQFIAENADIGKMRNLVILFTDEESFTYRALEPTLGCAISLVVYFMKTVREACPDPTFLMAIYLEEMCHVLWNLSDEMEVKEKVTEIINQGSQEPVDIWTIYDRGAYMAEQ